MFNINPGELKHKIEIERFETAKDDDNKPIEIWTSLLKPKSKIVNVRGKEVTIANGTSANIEKSFYIRYPKTLNITNKDRVIYKGSVFNISYTNNVEEANKWLEIRGIAIE